MSDEQPRYIDRKEKSLKTKLKVYRAMYDLTQDELAKLVDVRRETISYIERGKYLPSIGLAYDLANALDTSIDELFWFE